MIHWAWLLLALLIGEFFGLFTLGLCSINKLTQTNEPFQITRGCNVCNGDDALMENSFYWVFVSSNGELGVFCRKENPDEDAPIISDLIERCPRCGRRFEEKV